ncbi:NADH-quinone oxidoreductase subunit L, partial [bacterium]|nr:NADH-quinone oxidoreductase subunit L [bacterium]
AGSVIHAMSHEQDMRFMGGIWKKIPFTYAVMWIGNLALAGLPFFAGFYSKDMILEAAFAAHSTVGTFAFWLGIAAAVMTAFYSWRLLIMSFHGKARADDKVMAHVHESPLTMTIPLGVLAFGAIFSGWAFYDRFVGHDHGHFWGGAIRVLDDVVEKAHHVPAWVPESPLGFFVRTFSGAHQFLYNKWYFDELFDWAFVKPARALGFGFWKSGDGALIDGCGPDGVAAATQGVAAGAARMQTGYVFHYAFAMVVGVVLFALWLSMFG